MYIISIAQSRGEKTPGAYPAGEGSIGVPPEKVKEICIMNSQPVETAGIKAPCY
jgi:hypothetical protein